MPNKCDKRLNTSSSNFRSSCLPLLRPSTQKLWVDPLTLSRQCAFFTSQIPLIDQFVAKNVHTLTGAEQSARSPYHLPFQLLQAARGSEPLHRFDSLNPSLTQHIHNIQSPVAYLPMHQPVQWESPEAPEDPYIALKYRWDLVRYPPMPASRIPRAHTLRSLSEA